MKFALSIVGLAMLCAACADQAASTVEPVVSSTVLVNGNDPLIPVCPPEPWCLAPIDRAVQELYNRNNTLSQWGSGTSPLNFHGESEYQAASSANNHLTRIWSAFEMEADVAIRHLNAYVAEVTRAVAHGTYSECAANQLVARANWVIGIIEAAVVSGFTPDMLANPTPFDCALSPVTPSGSGSISTGVTLTWLDPWGFQTYYEVEKPGGIFTTTTTASLNDADANVANASYTYSVRQCAETLGCSEWTSVSVIVTAGPAPSTCAHDNRNGTFTPPRGQPNCEKEIKVGHPVKS